jgi:hypothetical protein
MPDASSVLIVDTQGSLAAASERMERAGVKRMQSGDVA